MWARLVLCGHIFPVTIITFGGNVFFISSHKTKAKTNILILCLLYLLMLRNILEVSKEDRRRRRCDVNLGRNNSVCELNISIILLRIDDFSLLLCCFFTCNTISFYAYVFLKMEFLWNKILNHVEFSLPENAYYDMHQIHS